MIDLLLTNSSYLLTLTGLSAPRTGSQMQALNAIKNGAIAVDQGKILETGTTDELSRKYQRAKQFINARQKLVMPGFVDCHTHLIYSGNRFNEMYMRIKGQTYLEILNQGGGIHATVEQVRASDRQQLIEHALRYLDLMLEHGTTSVEIKSGYGLDFENEKKMLQAINELKKCHPISIVATYLGAHAIPRHMSRENYIQSLLEQDLPQLTDLALFCDIFCEKGAFSLPETQKILSAAREMGYQLKIHAGQFNDLGAAGYAASLQAVSADHLEKVSDEQLDLMKKNSTTAVLLPGVPFFLLTQEYADARRMIDQHVPVALATDFNPGSCPCFSMPMMISLACFKMKMTIEEAITASTINAAWACGLGAVKGSLDKGKDADLIILDIDRADLIPYHFGTNLVSTVIKEGKLALSK